MPMPRKLSAASAVIAAPTLTAISTMVTGSELGTRCRKMMRVSELPMARAASTYCMLLSVNARERTTRTELAL